MTEELDIRDFYTRTPGEVRFNKKLPYGARLLWGDLAFLCNKTGACWWPNSKFAELYEVSERTIINWLDALEEEGLITRSECTHPDTFRVERKIVLTEIELYKKKKESEETEEISEEPENDFQGEEKSVSQQCEKIFTPVYSNSNNIHTKKVNNYIEFNKIQDSSNKVKKKFNNYDQRNYSSDFYAALENKMLRASP